MLLAINLWVCYETQGIFSILISDIRSEVITVLF